MSTPIASPTKTHQDQERLQRAFEIYKVLLALPDQRLATLTGIAQYNARNENIDYAAAAFGMLDEFMNYEELRIKRQAYWDSGE